MPHKPGEVEVTITVEGWLADYRPLVRCRVSVPGLPFGPTHGIEVVALLDTGATDCFVRSDLLPALGASATGVLHTTNIGTSGLKPTLTLNYTFVGFGAAGGAASWTGTDARTIVDTFDSVAQIIVGMNVLTCLQEFSLRDGVPRLIARSNKP